MLPLLLRNLLAHIYYGKKGDARKGGIDTFKNREKWQPSNRCAHKFMMKKAETTTRNRNVARSFSTATYLYLSHFDIHFVCYFYNVTHSLSIMDAWILLSNWQNRIFVFVSRKMNVRHLLCHVIFYWSWFGGKFTSIYLMIIEYSALIE